MAAHEAAVAELYGAYAKRVPQYEKLFLLLQEEEVRHARLLADFVEKVRDGAVRVRPECFRSRDILASLDHLREHLRKAREGEVSAIEALSTAVDLESDLIEKRWFEIVETDDPELLRLLQTLAADQMAHGERLRLEYERARHAGS
jgi:rubrerythrin